MEKFRFRKKDEVLDEGEMHRPGGQQQGVGVHRTGAQQKYLALQPRYEQDAKRAKQHTNWSGVLQDLFGLDSPQTAESTHESTSSGVASDVTSVYPSTPAMTTFKGESAGSAKSIGSQDSGTKSASLSSSPKPDPASLKQHLRGSRMSPAPPLPAIPVEPPGLPVKNIPRTANTLSPNDYHRMNKYSESPTIVTRGKKNTRDRRPRLPEPDVGAMTVADVNRSLSPQTNGHNGFSINTSDPRAMDPSFYNEITLAFKGSMREDPYIEAFRDDRFLDPRNPDRIHTVPSPVSPVPPGGYYYNRDVSPNVPERWLVPDMAIRDSRIRHKQQQHLQQQQLQQQQHIQQQQQHLQQQQQLQQQQHLHQLSAQQRLQHHHQHQQQQYHQDPTLQTRAPSCPITNDPSPTTLNQNHTPYPHNAPHPTRGAYPTPNHLIKSTTVPSKALQQYRNQYNDLQPETGFQNLPPSYSKSSHTLQTQAQVHAQQPEVSADWMKSAHAQSDTQLHVNQPTSTRQLTSGVRNLSLSQNDVSAGITVKGKRQMSRSCPFESLPNELLLKIFLNLPTDHLCRCAQVCRHWYNAVWDHPVLWTSIVINNPNLDIDKALKYLTRRLSYNTPKICMIVEKINVNMCCQLTDRGLQTAVKRCPELRYLDMQGCHLVTNVGVTEAVSRCVNLERLDVTGCPQVTCISLTDSLMTLSSPHHLERIYLRYLDMTDCPHVTDEDLFVITSQCTQLLFFYLRRCPHITDLGVNYIATNCSSLRELSLSDCTNVTDLGMRELTRLRDNLRYLSVAKCEKVSDEGVIHIARSCSKLRYLNVRGCEAFSDIGLEFVARNCPRIRSLDIGKCDITDEGMYILARYCPNLRKLGIKSCDGITDKGIVLLAYGCSALQQLIVSDCCLSPDAYAIIRKYCKKAIIEHTNPGVL
ncbi:protein split ends-like [Physella acuta]|uniref:protein split ends-like n=1 Tax=Physella acuta TaxID=109671 RepID=UPI0027DB7CD8|nr:protein split ends-like [Physella acuta]XP_059146555.1 protein split ends-like [Physella acuta]XP_059146556.1 protein split ends-like [Physella acuta]XP_059146558.1 protein split ends-like [Physella acuta]